MGGALSETTLATALGISRTPIREALMRLKTEGLVRVVPQKGTFVFTADAREIRDICDLRAALEPPALRLAVQRAPQPFAARLDEIVGHMRARLETGKVSEYLALDTRFHWAFFEFCENAYLCQAYKVIAAKMATLRNRLGRDPDHTAKSLTEHAAIAAAVSAADVDGALRVLDGHIGRKQGSYWADPEAVAGGEA